MPPRPPPTVSQLHPAFAPPGPTTSRHGRSADGWRTADALGRDHPLTTLRAPSPRAVAEAMRHDPTAAVWWLARADRIAAVVILGARTGRFASVEGVVYRVAGETVWDALDALTARGPLSPRDAALFPPDVLSAWGAGAAPEALPDLYLPTPPHTGFRVLAYGATGWERPPTGLPGEARHTRTRAPYADTLKVLCRLHTAAELRAFVAHGIVRYLPGTDPRWSLARGGGAAGAGVDPVARFYRPEAPDPADLAGTSLAGLDAPGALDAIPAPWRDVYARWLLPVAGSTPGEGSGANTGHRIRRAFVVRLGALPTIPLNELYKPSPGLGAEVDDDEDGRLTVPIDRLGWLHRVEYDHPQRGAPLAATGPHSLGAFLDAHAIPLPPGLVPLGEGLAVWVGPRLTASFLRSILGHLAMACVREALRAYILDTGGPEALATLRARFAPGAAWDGPDGTAPVSLGLPPPAQDPAAPRVRVWRCSAPPAAAIAVEASRGFDAARRAPPEAVPGIAEAVARGPWYAGEWESSTLWHLLSAAYALAGEGPASAPMRLVGALVWPDHCAARLLRVQYAALGLTVVHWRALVSAVIAWLDTGAPIPLPVAPASLWWAVQVGVTPVVGLGPTRSRHPQAVDTLGGRVREALARYDATLARPDAPEALAMIRADRERVYAMATGTVWGGVAGPVESGGGDDAWAEGLDEEG